MMMMMMMMIAMCVCVCVSNRCRPAARRLLRLTVRSLSPVRSRTRTLRTGIREVACAHSLSPCVTTTWRKTHRRTCMYSCKSQLRRRRRTCVCVREVLFFGSIIVMLPLHSNSPILTPLQRKLYRSRHCAISRVSLFSRARKRGAHCSPSPASLFCTACLQTSRPINHISNPILLRRKKTYSYIYSYYFMYSFVSSPSRRCRRRRTRHVHLVFDGQ